MTLCSMTGFARADGAIDGASWSWEVKSVNGRNLDLRFRLPPGFDRLEAQARALIADRIRRGSLFVALTFRRTEQPVRYRVNEDALDQIVAAMASLQARVAADLPRLDGLMRIKGVLTEVEAEESEETRERLGTALATTLAEALDGLGRARLDEGSRLQVVILRLLNEIAELVGSAAGCAAAQPAALQKRLREQLAVLLGADQRLTEERLVQEAALLAAKADIREEIDRLTGHVAQARNLVEGAEAAGRRLDFLCQEFNREANTLCSKSPDLELTRTGLDLKAAIERLREQIQNVE